MARLTAVEHVASKLVGVRDRELTSVGSMADGSCFWMEGLEPVLPELAS